jgi:hypothetical protein
MQQHASASTGVYESAATPTEANMQHILSASSGVSVPDASKSTDAHIQKLLSSTVYAPAASTPTEANMQQLVSSSTISTIVRDATIEDIFRW